MKSYPFYRFELAEFSPTTPQCYASFNLMFLLQGSASVQVGARILQLHPHDFVWFNVYEIHQFLTIAPETQFLLLMSDESYLKTVAPELVAAKIHTHMLAASDDNQLYTLFCREFGNFLYHHTVRMPAGQLQCLSHIGSLLTCIMRQMTTDTAALRPSQKDHLYQALTYISQFYTTELSLTQIADHVGMNAQYFSRYFKQHMGMSAIAYVNQLRIVNSLTSVLHSGKSLLDIALDCGFNNYKTYSTAFKKVFHTTPQQWKKQQLARPLHSQTIETTSAFAFFRSYWTAPVQEISTEPAKTTSNNITLELNASRVISPQTTLPEICYSIGRAADLLRGDIQQYVKTAAKELHIRHLRLRNVFSDDLFVYYETPDKTSIYNWQYIDMIYDFLIDLDIQPYTELGFMPRMLASKQQFANWQHRPNVSFPRSLKNWSRLVENFIRHLFERYGKNRVLTWKFNVWTSPDLTMKGGYWHESMESFFLFYRVTYNAVKSLDEQLFIGGADFSLPNGLDWYRAFFDYCRQYDLKPDFLTVHLYADVFDTTDRMQKNRYLNDTSSVFTQNNTPLYQSFWDFLTLIQQDPTFCHTPVVISDWNKAYHAADYARDTCIMSALIARTFSALCPTQVEMLGFRSLCDVNEDYFPGNRLFGGGPGLMDIHGIKKASYYAFQQLNRLGNQVLANGDHYILTRSLHHVRLLLFHADAFTRPDAVFSAESSYEQRYNGYDDTQTLSICLILTLDPGHYLLRQTSINRTSGSAYDLWLDMGAPSYESPEILDYIRTKSTPDCNYRETTVKDHLLLNVDLPQYGINMIDILRVE